MFNETPARDAVGSDISIHVIPFCNFTISYSRESVKGFIMLESCSRVVIEGTNGREEWKLVMRKSKR